MHIQIKILDMTKKLITGYLIKVDDMPYEVCITKHTMKKRFKNVKKDYADNYSSLSGLVFTPL